MTSASLTIDDSIVVSPVFPRQFGRFQILFPANMDDLAMLKFESDKSPEALLGEAAEIINGSLSRCGHCVAAFRPSSPTLVNSSMNWWAGNACSAFGTHKGAPASCSRN